MERAPLVFVPYVSFSPGKVAFYSRVEGFSRAKKPSFIKVLEANETIIEPWVPTGNRHLDAQMTDYINAEIGYQNLRLNKSTGLLSKAAKNRLLNGINWLYVLSDEKKIYPDKEKSKTFKISMITLSLSAKQMHTDKEIKSEMLSALIEKLKYNHGLKSYVWRAEIQSKSTGNIHFHIISNVYVNHMELRKYWNDIQRRFGYIDQFNLNNPSAKDYDNPNSTDVHSAKNIRDLVKYLAKYMCKAPSELERNIEGRQWFLSSNLSKIKPLAYQEDNELVNEVAQFGKKAKMFKPNEYVTVLYANIFTSDLAKYPSLDYVKKQAFLLHHGNVN